MPERYNLARLISQIKKNRARCIRNRRFFDQCDFGFSCLCYSAEGWLWMTKKVWLNLLKQTLAWRPQCIARRVCTTDNGFLCFLNFFPHRFMLVNPFSTLILQCQ